MKEFVTLPFRPATSPSWYGPVGYAVTVAGIALATAVMHGLLPFVSLATTYLVYLVIVVTVSVGWGLKQGIVASVLGFLAANFFFTQPLFTFTVAAVQDVVALATFLGLATLTSQLVAQLRREAQDARRSQQITSTLYALSQTLTGQQSLPRMLDEITAQLCSVLNLAACRVTLGEAEGPGSMVIASAGPPHDWNQPSPRKVKVSLSVAGHPGGSLEMLLPPHQRSLTGEGQQVAAAFAEQLQAALERVQLQQAAVQMEVLRRTDALRAALLSAVAHDLRTPLTTIKTAATSMLSTRVEWTTDEQQAYLNAIVEEVDRINRIAGNLLDVSRIEAGQLQPHKERHHIREVVETVVERLRPRLLDHTVSVQVEADLPAVFIDGVQIDEVLTNLLENAIKYTPPGTAVEVRADKQGHAIGVEVADNGPGIPPEHMPHLFNRFYRVMGGRVNSAPGSGLGLAIVKGIVEAHGGEVSAYNAPRGGAIFRFTLPLYSSSRAEGWERAQWAEETMVSATPAEPVPQGTNRSFRDG